MSELNYKQRLLVTNWQKKNGILSEIVINSLIGLTTWETILALGVARKQFATF